MLRTEGRRVADHEADLLPVARDSSRSDRGRVRADRYRNPVLGGWPIAIGGGAGRSPSGRGHATGVTGPWTG